MASATLFDNSGGSSTSSSMLESVELRSRNKNHQTAAMDPWRRQESPTINNGRVPLMEHVVKKDETLMQISLLYSVPVSEIKRVNNIVADQEIHALPIVRVPVSRSFILKRQLMESAAGAVNSHQQQPIVILGGGDDPMQQQSTSTLMRTEFTGGNDGTSYTGVYSDKIPLLDDQDQQLHKLLGSNESLSSNGSNNVRARQAIEGILDETDRTVLAMRQNLPSPTLEGGAFHFVDAGAPDNSSSIWLIVAILVIIFVLLPLGLTFLEETGELEEHHSQKSQIGGLAHHSSAEGRGGYHQ